MTERKPLKYINFNQLRSFYAVGQLLNFTKAAEWLNIGQPTVTTQVKMLEETYNIKLFQRSPNGLELTDAGTALMTMARQIFALADRTHTLLESTGNTYAGKLHIGTVGPFFVMDLLSEYVAKYPLIQVSVESGNSDTIYRRLLEYQLDVAILGEDHADAQLEQVLLGRHEVAIVVNKQHHWAHRDSVSLNELDGQRIIFREQGSMTRRALEEQLSANGIRPNVVMELSRDSVIEAVAQGLGAGILSVEEFSNDGRLSLLRIPENTPTTSSYAVCLKERISITPLRVFMDLAKRDGVAESGDPRDDPVEAQS